MELAQRLEAPVLHSCFPSDWISWAEYLRHYSEDEQAFVHEVENDPDMGRYFAAELLDVDPTSVPYVSPFQALQIYAVKQNDRDRALYFDWLDNIDYLLRGFLQIPEQPWDTARAIMMDVVPALACMLPEEYDLEAIEAQQNIHFFASWALEEPVHIVEIIKENESGI